MKQGKVLYLKIKNEKQNSGQTVLAAFPIRTTRSYPMTNHLGPQLYKTLLSKAQIMFLNYFYMNLFPYKSFHVI